MGRGKTKIAASNSAALLGGAQGRLGGRISAVRQFEQHVRLAPSGGRSLLLCNPTDATAR
jgi:hypothetical protein